MFATFAEDGIQLSLYSCGSLTFRNKICHISIARKCGDVSLPSALEVMFHSFAPALEVSN